MPARSASGGEGSPSVSPSRPSANQTTSSGFSSAPVAPVVANSHSRRRKGDAGWLKSGTADAQNQNGNDGSSPSSSGTQDEDIRSKSRPGSAESQNSSSSKKEDATMGDEDDAPLVRARDRPKAPNITQFPSLSSGSAALLQLREHARNASPSTHRNSGGAQSAGSGSSTNRPVENIQSQKKLPPQTSINAGAGQNQPNSFHRSRSGSRERDQNPIISQDEDMNGDEDEDDDVDDLDDDPNSPPSPSERDVRIMFHGREVYAEDLIGLRVAKTFAGLGRFLGQVVKFDNRAALYTVVYADGDAEDLSIDSTLQILIQNEIERADPAQVPPVISLLFKKGEAGSSPARPDSGDFMMHQLPAQRRTPQQRLCIQVSDREAQLVISLFENHALPSLMRQGWRVQTSTSGSGEACFLSPAREMFSSPLDVVGYIASDNELLTSCFPANVHSAILSLLPQESPAGPSNLTDTIGSHGSSGGGARKRTTSDSPSAEQFDGKRTRQMREESYGEASLPARGGVVRGGNTSMYRPDDLDRRAEAINRISAYRGQGVAGRIRTAAPDRYNGGETTSEPRIQAPPELRGYRRPSSHEESVENPFASRWSNGPPVGGYPEAAEYHRRFVDSPLWRERGDSYLSVDRTLDAHPRNRARAEGRFPHRINPRNAVDGAHASGTSSGTPTGYKYRDSMDSPSGGQTSPMTGIPGYPQYAPLRTKHDITAGDYRINDVVSRSSAAPRVSRETASFMSPTDTLGANAAFSMVDVDRISQSRPGSGHIEQQLHGRSPRHPDAQQGYHRRTGSGHSYHNQRGNEDHYMGEGASESQGELHNAPPSAPSQQHN